MFRTISSIVCLMAFVIMSNENFIVIDSVTITPIKPDGGGITLIRFQYADPNIDMDDKPTFLVKMYIDTLDIDLTEYKLHIAGKRIREYAGFKNGIFFKIYKQDALSLYSNQPIHFVNSAQDTIIPDSTSLFYNSTAIDSQIYYIDTLPSFYDVISK